MHKTDCEFELLNNLAEGDPDAFTAVYKQHYERIYKFARIFVPDNKDAEDITAETFIKLWNRRQHFKSTNDIIAFLHVTSRNRCFDVIRHKKVKLEKQVELIRQLELSNTSALQETKDELLNLIAEQIAKMSTRLQQIYDLSYNQGMSPAQIAEHLKISVQTVSNQKTAIVKTLKRTFAHHSYLPVILLLLEGQLS